MPHRPLRWTPLAALLPRQQWDAHGWLTRPPYPIAGVALTLSAMVSALFRSLFVDFLLKKSGKIVQKSRSHRSKEQLFYVSPPFGDAETLFFFCDV